MKSLAVSSKIDNVSAINWTYSDRFNSAEKLELFERLLSQETLVDLLDVFASWIEQYLPICRMHYVYQEQKISVISRGNGIYKQHYSLRCTKAILLGKMTYTLSEKMRPTQHRLLLQANELLCIPLRMILKMEELDKQVRLDHLTAIGNRAYFDEELHLAIAQNNRQFKGLTLMLIDLDKFKQINDNHGHPTGDNVLKMFAALLSSVVRKTDKVFRLGGDEFALLLQPADNNTAGSVINRLEINLEKHEELKSWNTAYSIGHVDWQTGINAKELYQKADEELYKNKMQKCSF
ncbi:GGDEF domain-containing protein [uncultured Tolumonas sp.]|uniref:GGDEF domain-containing protein n=1 Tax=uncultured Tolumonas sp. TaxID=263765 RepID=UPI002930343E|nr:GGDEF domain-containing protein [uncultured Tolumonas sp.]